MAIYFGDVLADGCYIESRELLFVLSVRRKTLFVSAHRPRALALWLAVAACRPPSYICSMLAVRLFGDYYRSDIFYNN